MVRAASTPLPAICICLWHARQSTRLLSHPLQRWKDQRFSTQRPLALRFPWVLGSRLAGCAFEVDAHSRNTHRVQSHHQDTKRSALGAVGDRCHPNRTPVLARPSPHPVRPLPDVRLRPDRQRERRVPGVRGDGPTATVGLIRHSVHFNGFPLGRTSGRVADPRRRPGPERHCTVLCPHVRTDAVT